VCLDIAERSRETILEEQADTGHLLLQEVPVPDHSNLEEMGETNVIVVLREPSLASFFLPLCTYSRAFSLSFLPL